MPGRDCHRNSPWPCSAGRGGRSASRRGGTASITAARGAGRRLNRPCRWQKGRSNPPRKNGWRTCSREPCLADVPQRKQRLLLPALHTEVLEEFFRSDLFVVVFVDVRRASLRCGPFVTLQNAALVLVVPVECLLNAIGPPPGRWPRRWLVPSRGRRSWFRPPAGARHWLGFGLGRVVASRFVSPPPRARLRCGWRRFGAAAVLPPLERDPRVATAAVGLPLPLASLGVITPSLFVSQPWNRRTSSSVQVVANSDIDTCPSPFLSLAMNQSGTFSLSSNSLAV